MKPSPKDRQDESDHWQKFCRNTREGGKDGYWVPNSSMSVIDDKDLCIKAAAEHDQKAKDKLIRYAIWRLKS